MHLQLVFIFPCLSLARALPYLLAFLNLTFCAHVFFILLYCLSCSFQHKFVFLIVIYVLCISIAINYNEVINYFWWKLDVINFKTLKMKLRWLIIEMKWQYEDDTDPILCIYYRIFVFNIQYYMKYKIRKCTVKICC